MFTFLHQRLDATAVAALVQRQANEDQHTEFKAYWGPWQPSGSRADEDRKYEAVKDIAAMANADGGEIVIGLSERQGRVSGFTDLPELPTGADQVRTWVTQFLEPNGIAQHLEVRLLSISEGAGARKVVVVSVPVVASGALAIRLDRQGRPTTARTETEHRSYAIPRRVGAATKFQGMDSELLATRARERSLYLRLRHLVGSDTVRIHLTAPILVWWIHGRSYLHSHADVDGNHGNLNTGGVKEMAIEIQMADHRIVPIIRGQPSHEVVPSPFRTLAIPYSEIRDAWPDPLSGGKVVHLAVNGCIIFDGTIWRLRNEPPPLGERRAS